MIGTTMDELYELVSHYHDAEFVYHGTTYVLQPEINKGKEFLVIWDCTPDNAKCIASCEIESSGDIPRSVIDSVLSQKCFDNNSKSFLEIEKDIAVEVIF